ncbi:MAG: hypothetical protein EHM35_06815 [Planctomycetaceae bacterium]|jgi:hypothetical protein|nr:MAG: hypothetical protein EHM35_06815 [Planctomycetaceae bacterium]
MRVEVVGTPSLLELRAIVAQRLQVYGAFEGYSAEDQRTILTQACLVIVHLTAGAEGRTVYLAHLEPSADRARYQMVLDTMSRLCPDVIATVQGYVAAWRARFWQDGWHPTQWAGYCDGVNAMLLELFVTDTRQQALAACERDVS